MRKNAHAVALGRKGGRARNRLPAAELSRIGKLGGRPRRYRFEDGTLYRLEAIIGTVDGLRGVPIDYWTPLFPPYDKAARAFLYRRSK